MTSLDDIRRALSGHIPLLLPSFGRKASAVLIPLLEVDGELSVVFTRRSATLPVHPGEISFPGGHIEADDASTLDAAMREAWEEIGLPANRCEVLGAMDDFSTVTGYRITPHVVLIRGPFEFKPLQEEVAEVLCVPWATFDTQPADYRLEVFRKGRREHFPLYRHEGHVIWGATARIMADFLDVVHPDGRTEVEIAASAVMRRVLAAKSVVLTTHVNPDPDGLCSEMAMEELLLSLGKKVTVVNAHPTPPIWPSIQFRSPLLHPPLDVAALASEHELMLIVDTSEHQRVGAVSDLAEAMTGRLAAIDHHMNGSMDHETVLLDSHSSSTCEIVYSLLQRAGFPFTQRACDALFMGIMYDTNGFRYINNRSLPLKAAAHLVEMGADAMAIQEELFSNVTEGRLKAQRIALERMQLEFDKQFAWSYLTREDCSREHIDDEDASEISSLMLSMQGVHISAFFKETRVSKPEARIFKLSMRSSRGYPIGPVCISFGGGGHANAAGATFPELPEQAMEKLRPLIKRVLDEATS